jgi:hypothetical protein
MPIQRRPAIRLTPPEQPEPPRSPEPTGSPAEPLPGAPGGDSTAGPPPVPLGPCHSPDTGRPFPDLMALRLARVPDPSPPFDDEIFPASPAGADEAWPFAVSGTADRTVPAAQSIPAAQPGLAPQPGPAAQSRPGPQSGRADHTRPERAQEHQLGGHRPAGSSAQPLKRPPGRATGPDLDAWPSQFAQVLAETLAGSRPASQIVPWTTERARAHIRRLGPLLAVQQRPRVQRVVTSRPAEGVVEFAAIVGFGSRTRALAGRLERAGPRPATPGRPSREARWLCTAVESA